MFNSEKPNLQMNCEALINTFIKNKKAMNKKLFFLFIAFAISVITVNAQTTTAFRKNYDQASFDFPGNIAVNTKGPFIQGGWKSDEGQNDAKPHRDGFASYGVCADSFSGEDPTKPEGPLTFLAREIANYVVRNRLAGFAKVYLSIDIGQKEPKTFNIFTNGTNHVPLTKIYRKVREEIPLTYGKMVQRFGLYNPSIYRQIAGDSDYFQNPGLPWNRILAK